MLTQSTNGRWWRLADAPFNPRAFIQPHYAINADFDLLSMRPAPDNPINGSGSLFLVGGQTAHHCGDPQLGECSSEIWLVNITRNLTLEANKADHPPLHLTWDRQMVGLMSFPSRCGAALISEARDITPGQARILGVAGGQMSFTAESDCRTAPIVTTNEVYYSSVANFSSWTLGRPAPFSARRSMQTDDALFMSDGGVYPIGTSRLHYLDKTISVGGGLRYVRREWDESRGVSRMTEAELFADVYSCTLITPEWDPSATDCDWSHTRRMANLSVPPPYLPTASLPVPIAHGPSARGQPVRKMWNIRWGGVTSEAAAAAWRATVPQGAADAFEKFDWGSAAHNLTLIAQPVLPANEMDFAAEGAPQPTVAETRYDLPTAWTVGEDELNSPNSSFVRGSDAVITMSVPTHYSTIQYQATTFHQQPSQMVQTAAESTAWLYLATSSLNTTRPLLDFTNRRFGHSMALSNAAVYLGGGISDGRYTNDWVTHEAALCLYPDDPSYYSTLGSGHIAAPPYKWDIMAHFLTHWYYKPGDEGGYAHGISFYTDVRLGPNTPFPWMCDDGFRFDPPTKASVVYISCTSSGLWMDTQLGSIRRCVPQALRCPAPFVDLGLGRCGDPEPVVTAVRIHGVGRGNPGRYVDQATNSDNATVIDIPSMGNSPMRNKLLYIHGSWLSQPVSITVFAQVCMVPQVRNSTRFCLDEADPTTCHRYGSLITCVLDLLPYFVQGSSFPVTITVGRRQTVISSISLVEWTVIDKPITLSIAPPRIHWLHSDQCKRPSDEPESTLRLVDCPINRPFEVVICSLNLDSDYNSGDSIRPKVYLSSVDEALSCDERSWAEKALPGSEVLCDSRLPNFPCIRQSTCANCTVPPRLGSGHVLRIARPTYEDYDLVYRASNMSAVISYASCLPGRFINISSEAAEKCQVCSAGRSTNNQTDQQECTPCQPGYFSSAAGAAICSPCPTRTFASASEATECEPCPGTSWQLLEGKAECRYCEAGQYPKWISNELQPTCDTCPLGSICNDGVNGTIVASPGAFVHIDDQTGAVSAVRCWHTACVGAETSPLCTEEQCNPIAICPGRPAPSVPLVTEVGLSLLNCCGENRRPAVSIDGEVNVLSAFCVDGHSEVRGRCVACDSIRWGMMFVVTSFALICMYVLHRFFPVSAAASGELPITVYFIQMSSLFMSGESLPAILSYVNVDVVGVVGSDPCVLPLTDYGKIAFRLLSPLFAVALLLVVLALHLLLRRLVLSSQWYTRELVQWHRSGDRLRYVAVSDREGDGGCPRQPLPGWLRIYVSAFGVPFVVEPALNLASPAFTDFNRQSLVSSVKPLHERLLDDSREPDTRPPAAVGTAAAVDCSVVPSGAHPMMLVGSLRSISLAYQQTLLRVLMISYNTLTAVCLAFFQTQDMGQFGRRLTAYPTVDPADATYAQLRPAIVFCLILVCVWPLALTVYLWRLKRRGTNAGGVTDQHSGVVVTAMFQPTFWYLPSLILLRRFVIILTLTFGLQEERFFYVLALNLVFYSAQMHLLPYLRPWDNWLECLTLAALSLQTILLSAHPSAVSRPPSTTAALWLLVLLPCLVLAFRPARRAFRWAVACTQQCAWGQRRRDELRAVEL